MIDRPTRLAKQVHLVTPLLHSRVLGAAAGVPVFLKMEALQPTGSFKARGMGAACHASHEAGVEHVVCASGGNAGYAVAYAGRSLGLQVTIVVPETTSTRAKDLILGEGATLVVHGESWDDSHSYAVQLARREQADCIHPFDDSRVWSGHSGLITEIADAGVKPGLLVVSVGGGGLLCGSVEGLHAVGWDDVPVLAVETVGADSFASSMQAGHLVTLPRISSVATSLGARTVTARALEWTRHHAIEPWVVTDREAVDACLRFADDHRVLVEPACGAALSTAYNRARPLQERGPVVIIVCGGAGVTRELLEKWDKEVQ
jgi:L-serine/L-threonine ammonia-lyase